MMNRFEKQNTLEAIESYFFPEPFERYHGGQKMEDAFNRAKNEIIQHTKKRLECLDRITFEAFKKKYGGGWK